MALLRKRLGAERRGTPADWLVIGLGNPGNQFDGTRHNVGAEVVEILARRHGTGLERSKERALTAEVTLGSARVALAFPQTFMNNSGESAQMLVRRYGIEDSNQIVIVHDELDLELGRLKLKAGGGLAGHNGLRSITQHLGTTDYCRLRIGIGKPPASQRGRDWVLRRPTSTEQEVLDVSVQRAADGVERLVASGIDAAMEQTNRRDIDS